MKRKKAVSGEKAEDQKEQDNCTDSGICCTRFIRLYVVCFCSEVDSDRQKSVAEHQKALAVSKITIAEQNALLADKNLAKADSIAAIATRKETEARHLTEIL